MKIVTQSCFLLQFDVESDFYSRCDASINYHGVEL